MRFTLALTLALSLSMPLWAAGCADESDDASINETPSTQSEGTTESDVTTPEPTQTAVVPEDCAYDEASKGTAIGSHVESFKLFNQHGDIHNSHFDCGGESKAVWVFLSTGWCGACNSYAKTII